MSSREELSTGSQDPPMYQKKRLWEAGGDPHEKKRRIAEENKRKSEEQTGEERKKMKKEDEEMIGAVEELKANKKSRVERKVGESRGGVEMVVDVDKISEKKWRR